MKKSVGVARLLAWLVPGAGHFYAGDRTRGVALFVLIGGLFVSGLMMKGGILTPMEDFISRLCMFGRIGAGLLWLTALFTNFRVGDMLSRCGEIGACYTAVAGLLNILVVLSIRDNYSEVRIQNSGFRIKKTKDRIGRKAAQVGAQYLVPLKGFKILNPYPLTPDFWIPE